MRLDTLVTPWAERTPTQQAVVEPSGVTSYAELEQLANRFARSFLLAGVQPGDRIGVHVTRSALAIAAMLGALRAGAVYVPMDPRSPPARMQLVANDCGLKHLVIAPSLLGNWLEAGVMAPVEQLYLSADGPALTLPPSVRVRTWAQICETSADLVSAPSSDPDELAYMLYTSGSTGVPKGVMLSHRNALAFVDWAADLIELSPSDRVSSVAPFHFDLSVFDIWSSLSRGATIIVVDETSVGSGPRMLDLIHEHAINVWYSVPSALILMLSNGDLETRGAPSLRVVFFAGEVFPMAQLRRTVQALPQARFFNLFGPTETNVCLAHTLEGTLGLELDAIPIGVPSCGDEAIVLDEASKPVARGEVGELFIEGPTVMLGYWDGGRRAPAKHPYPTGDLVSQRPDGAYMYHGRRDHLVKIRGFRVELGEVEAALAKHEGVLESLAFAIDQKLVAVVVPREPSGLSVLELKRHCTQRLPQYMVPSEVRLVMELPRTSNGKADRVRTKAALIESDTSILKPISGAAAQRTP